MNRKSPPKQVRERAAAFLAASLILLGACAANQDVAPADEMPVGGAKASDELARVLLFDFDAISGPLVEGAAINGALPTGTGGVLRLAGPTAQALTLVRGEGDGGQALAFPGSCSAAADASCAKAIVEVDHAPALNPGKRNFGYGVSVLLQPDQTSKGSNVIQKGFSRGGGSQWKLQMDGLEGQPACVLVGTDDETVYQARSDVSVADGRWHDVSCRRVGDVLIIGVDGADRASAELPAGLSIEPSGPVRIGGKNLKSDNDQYFGVLDNIFIDHSE